MHVPRLLSARRDVLDPLLEQYQLDKMNDRFLEIMDDKSPVALILSGQQVRLYYMLWYRHDFRTQIDEVSLSIGESIWVDLTQCSLEEVSKQPDKLKKLKLKKLILRHKQNSQHLLFYNDEVFNDKHIRETLDDQLSGAQKEQIEKNKAKLTEKEFIDELRIQVAPLLTYKPHQQQIDIDANLYQNPVFKTESSQKRIDSEFPLIFKVYTTSIQVEDRLMALNELCSNSERLRYNRLIVRNYPDIATEEQSNEFTKYKTDLCNGRIFDAQNEHKLTPNEALTRIKEIRKLWQSKLKRSEEQLFNELASYINKEFGEFIKTEPNIITNHLDNLKNFVDNANLNDEDERQMHFQINTAITNLNEQLLTLQQKKNQKRKLPESEENEPDNKKQRNNNSSKNNSLNTHPQTEMEGFNEANNKGLVVIGATNHLKKIVPPIKSRFGKPILLPLPDENQLASIYKNIILAKKNIGLDLKLSDEKMSAQKFIKFAKLSAGFSVRDVVKVIDDAIRVAVSRNKQCATLTTKDITDQIKKQKSDCQASQSPGFFDDVPAKTQPVLSTPADKCIEYHCHKVLADGDCGYASFGITRQFAVQLLQKHKNNIHKILQPAIKEVLVTKQFVDYLHLTGVLAKSITVSQVTNKLDQFSQDLSIIAAYINYDVKEKHVDAGWAHPAVLMALAQIRDIPLSLWQFDHNNNLILHQDERFRCYQPASTDQPDKHLVFVNGNHFELLEFTYLKHNTEQPNPKNITKKIQKYGVFAPSRAPSQSILPLTTEQNQQPENKNNNVSSQTQEEQHSLN